MIKILKDKGITPEKTTNVKFLPKVLSAAAMFIILTVAVFSLTSSFWMMPLPLSTPWRSSPTVIPFGAVAC